MGTGARMNQESKKARSTASPPGKRLYTIREAAAYLGRTEWGVRDLIWSREIPVVKGASRRKIYIDINDLEAYVTRNKSEYR
jgi:excisionase family DNA binding protein